jgi:hypothetical protein
LTESAALTASSNGKGRASRAFRFGWPGSVMT